MSQKFCNKILFSFIILGAAAVVVVALALALAWYCGSVIIIII